MTANTLLLGWWGAISLIATPVTLLINLVRRGKVAGLGAPQRVPGVVGALAPAPLDPGKPVLARPQSITLFVLLGVLVVLSIISNM